MHGMEMYSLLYSDSSDANRQIAVASVVLVLVYESSASNCHCRHVQSRGDKQCWGEDEACRSHRNRKLVFSPKFESALMPCYN